MGSLVAVRLPPGRSFLRRLDAAWGNGDAVLPLDPAAPDDAVARTLDQLRPSIMIDARGATDLPDPVPVADGTAAVVLTSGTTGPPKGALLSHRALDAAATAAAARLGSGAGDRWLSVLPLHHIAGLMVVVRARLAGGEAVVHDHFDPARIAAEPDVTLVSVVPTMLVRLLDAAVDLSRFRAVLVGGARCPRPLLERARRAGVPVVRTYGMTETCGGVVYDGVPLAGVEVRIADEGEITLRGPMLFDGYRGRDGLTATGRRAGWFHTRDLGRFEHGRLVVLGRADDVIVTGGEKVVPGEVEAVLLEHPAVADVQVVRRDDPEWGEIVVARVVARGRAPSLQEVRSFVKNRLRRSAAPRVVEAVDRIEPGQGDKTAGES